MIRCTPRWAPALVAALLVATSATGCTRSSGSSAGRLTVDGQADVTRPGEDRREVTGSTDLEIGDRVRVRRGSAVVRLPGGRRLEMRVGSDIELQATPEQKQAQPGLFAGDLLVISGDSPVTVSVAGAQVAVQGDARVSRGVALLAGTYTGTAQLGAGGSTLTVPALRQAALPATEQFPSRGSPLEVSPADAWDQRYLSDAIQLGNELASRSAGFTGQLGPTEGRTFNYFRDLLPRLAEEPAFTAALLDRVRPPGETLVGAAITLEGARGTFAERWAAVFGFRDQGAQWGLVAKDQDVDRAPLLAAIERAIGRGPTLFASGPPTRPPGALATPGNGSPATSVVPPTTTATVRPRPGASTTTVPAGRATTTTTPTGPLNTGSPLIDNTVNSLVDTLTGLLRSLGGQ